MKWTVGIAPVLALLLALAPAAQAQKIYRCGPDGREYSQVPCKDGRPIDAADPRSPEQRRDAEDVTQAQKRLAKQLETERREREAKAAATGPAALTVPKPATAAASEPADWCHKDGKPRRKAYRDYCERLRALPAAGPSPSPAPSPPSKPRT